MVDLACPVPDCNYKPPASMSAGGQEKALGRHIELSHSIGDITSIVDAMKEPVAESIPEKEQVKPAESVGVQQRPARVTEPKSKLAAVTSIGDPKKERIAERAESWGQYLYKDFNPLLVSGVQQFAGIPGPWLDGGPANGQPIQLQLQDGKVVTFWDPTLRVQLSLSESDCKKIAKAGATFAESPMGQALTMFIESNSHWIALGSALLVAGSYGWKVMRIKTEVAQLKNLLEEQMKMQTPQTASNEAA